MSARLRVDAAQARHDNLAPDRLAESVPLDPQRSSSTANNTETWRLSTFAGRLGEISGSRDTATLTLAFRLILEAQRQGEPVAWVARRDSVFYPPDVTGTAVDLEALIVVRTNDTRMASRAADLLLRSGAFGLVVVDLAPGAVLPIPVQARLIGLAKKHEAAIVCITDKEEERPSLGSLVSIRAAAARTEKVDDRFLCRARVLKDKRVGPGRTHVEVCHGPAGLH